MSARSTIRLLPAVEAAAVAVAAAEVAAVPPAAAADIVFNHLENNRVVPTMEHDPVVV